jgi:AcrR family transcriptional regulator
MQLFWEKGYEGTATADLVKAMGVQPASLYRTFGNKEQLFQRALERYLAGPVSFMREALQEPTAFEVARRILRESALFLSDRRNPRGCLTIQAAMVGGDESLAVRQDLVRLRVRAQDALRRRLERAKEEGDLPPEADARDLAQFVTAVFQGMTVQSINGAKRDELLRLAETAMRTWPQCREQPGQ